MAETLNKDELLGKALATDLPVVPSAASVSLKAPEPMAAPVDFSGAKAEKTIPVKENYMAAIKPDMDALRVAEEEKLKFAGLEKIDLAEREAAKQYKLGESAAQQKREILDDPARAQYKKALEDKAKPFVPYEENAQDLMTLFGLLNVVGFAIGSGGKEYSQAAMSAMNGMLEGHRKGREDLYKKEKSIFETNQRQLDSRIKQLLAFMQDNQLLTNMDKTARDNAIQSEFLQTGATFLSEYYKKNGYGKTVETLKEMARASGKAAELVAKEEARAADQEFTLRLEAQKAREAREQDRNKVLAQYDLASQKLTAEAKQAESNNNFALAKEISRRAFDLEKAKADWTHGENLAGINRKHATDIELARIERDKVRDKDTAEYRLREKDYQDKRLGFEKDRLAETERHNREKEKIDKEAAKNRASSTTGTGLKPGAKVTEAYVADNQLKTDIEDILKDLRTNPSLVNDLKKYRVEAFLTEEGKVLNQLVSEDIPPNLRQFLTKVRDVRNNYYLNISGKAVTGGEALRSYGTVPQPGDNAAQMIDKLSGMSNRVSQAISIKQQLYGLPSLNLNAGGATSLVPNEDYSRDTPSSPAATGAKQAMPSEARMKEYAKDPYFGGDVEKAKAYLRSKGYQ
jgi:hypothetical protein